MSRIVATKIIPLLLVLSLVAVNASAFCRTCDTDKKPARVTAESCCSGDGFVNWQAEESDEGCECCASNTCSLTAQEVKAVTVKVRVDNNFVAILKAAPSFIQPDPDRIEYSRPTSESPPPDSRTYLEHQSFLC